MGNIQNNLWKYNQNFSFLHLCKETHINDKAESSLFQGTVIENNTWENVSISNSDLEATRIIHTTIKDSTFANTDIHSLIVTNSNFYNVSFQSADITDCTFIDCQFINCSFEEAVLKDSEFINCILKKPLFFKGSYLMNSFSKCTFKDTCLKNVFYYTFFDECIFNNVIIEAYLLGFTYGLTINNLETLSYLIMGKPVEYEYQKICRKIIEIYKERKMIINQGVLYLSDPNIYVEQAIIECFQFLYKFIQNDYIVQKEQLAFLGKILNIIYEKKYISPLGLICLMNIIDGMLNIKMNSSLKKAKSGIIIIQNSILLHYQSLIDTLTENLTKLPQNGKFEIKIVYKEQPTYRLTNIIEDFDSTKQAFVTKTEIGSFIEWIECAANVLPFIDTFFNFIGIAMPLATILKSQKEKTTEESHADCIIQINNNIDVSNLSQKQLKKLPEIIEKSINPILQSDVNKTVKFILNNNFVDTKNRHGYTIQNIKSIEINQLKDY